ncbi:MAG: hypothetical protein ACYC3L_00610 [Gemmatimonadaceae bacterium]|jgi:hypothetical protein
MSPSRPAVDLSIPFAGAASSEMPSYRSHKKVWALQIQYVADHTLSFMEAGYAPRTVDPALFVRYTPVPGDYFVVYADGYESISPRAAFEEGYTKET